MNGDPIIETEWPGYCPVCEAEVVFVSRGSWHRDQLICKSCRSVPRQRALVSVLSMVEPGWRSARVWELAPAGPASEKLRTECANYMSSHYLPDRAPGTVVNGIRHEDLERPTFDDGSFDIVISSDVFEHVIDVDAALAQVARVLDDDGIHVWTTPQYRDLENSKPRVRRTGAGLEHLVPPEYHGDPVSRSGALVTFDWGRDLPTRVLAASGMHTSVFRIESTTHGLLGEFLEVFVSYRGTAAPMTRQAVQPPESEIAILRTQLKTSRSTVAKMKSSNSWRMTRPLRRIRGLLGRGPH